MTNTYTGADIPTGARQLIASADAAERELGLKVDALSERWMSSRENVQQSTFEQLAAELMAQLPPVNVPLLRKAVEWVEEQAALPHGGAWIQAEWVTNLMPQAAELRGCGTAYCLAGYVASQSFPELAHAATAIAEFDGDELTISTSEVSDSLLGITFEHHRLCSIGLYGNLYGGGNSAERIRQLAEYLAGEAL